MPDGFSKAPSGVRGIDLMQNPALKQFVAEMEPSKPAAPPAPEPLPQAPQGNPPAPMSLDDLPPPEAPVKTPQELYLDGLKEQGISMDEAARIVDAMIVQGFYAEDVKITKNLSVRFRTRGQDAADRVNKALTDLDPKYNGVLYSLIAKYNLAASLVKYGPHDLDPSTDAGFNVSMSYITTKIPLPVYQVLITKLAKFDEKLSAVMKEEAVNFF